jgi:hypothetical protein
VLGHIDYTAFKPISDIGEVFQDLLVDNSLSNIQNAWNVLHHHPFWTDMVDKPNKLLVKGVSRVLDKPETSRQGKALAGRTANHDIHVAQLSRWLPLFNRATMRLWTNWKHLFVSCHRGAVGIYSRNGNPSSLTKT